MRRLALAVCLTLAVSCSGSNEGPDASTAAGADASEAPDAAAVPPDGGLCTPQGETCGAGLPACCSPASCAGSATKICCRLSGAECTENSQCCSNQCKANATSSTGYRCVISA